MMALGDAMRIRMRVRATTWNNHVYVNKYYYEDNSTHTHSIHTDDNYQYGSIKMNPKI